jgi:hypothetical protein
MAEKAIPSCQQTIGRVQVAFFVPLSPFERQLLIDLDILLNQHHFARFDPQNTPIIATFKKWHWSSLIKRCLNDDLGEKSLHDEYRGIQ